MKRLLIIAAAFALVGVNAQADDAAASSHMMKWGVHAGVNMASTSATVGTVSASSDSKIGFLAGVLLDWNVWDFISIQPELNFTQKGGKTAGVSATYNYIEIPVFAKATFEAGPVRPFLEVGPAFGFLLSASSAGNDLKPNMKSTEFSLTFGGGAGMNVSEGIDLHLDLRYSLGLTDLAKNSVANTSTKNKGFQILAGVTW